MLQHVHLRRAQRGWCSMCFAATTDLQHIPVLFAVYYKRAPSLCRQELQAEGWTPEEGDAQAGAAAPSAGEHRDICARVENMVVPELGSLAARCSRLVSQASVAFGARTRLET